MLETPQKKGYLIMEHNSLQEDNQQESSTQDLIDLGWLGGIFDGEGTITITIRGRKNQTDLLTPRITVANTDKIIIDKITQIYKKYNIPYWISYYKSKGNWKESWRVEITGIKRSLKILPILKKYLVAKKDLADDVLSWCESRKNDFGKRTFYSDKDLEIVKKIKARHGHKLVLKSSETIR
jgi:hypothetical protein